MSDHPRMSGITFNGHDLLTGTTLGGYYGAISDVRDSYMERDVQLIDVAGMDGAHFGNTNLEPRTFTMTMTLYGTPIVRARALENITGWLYNNGQPGQLAFEDRPDIYWNAVAAITDIERYVDGLQVEITFTCADPVAYGQLIDNVPIGEQFIDLAGNYPAKPVIRCSNATNGDGNVWGVRLDDQDFVHVALPTADSDVVIDCQERTVTVNGVTALLTLDSDWLSISPGISNPHTFTLDEGAGDATIEWRQRWI